MSQAPGGDAAGGTLKPRIEGLVNQFNERAKSDENLRETLKDMERTIQLDVAGDGTYHFLLKDYKIDGVRDGPTADPQIQVTTDKATLTSIMDGELSPTRAYMSKKFKVKATMLDLLVLRKLF
jgi:putative sterol carrier protein